MSQLLKKPIVLHIAAEVIIMGGITFYFQRRILKLEASMKNVIENVQKIHDVLFQHEKVINNIISGGNRVNNTNEKNSTHNHKKNKPKNQKPPQKPPQKSTKSAMKKMNTVLKEESESEDFSDSDLDEELTNELNELKNNNLKRNDNEEKDDE